MTSFTLGDLQVVTTFALFGLIWVVQLVQYPGLRLVPAQDFVRYHRHHCATIGWIVGPLMLGELAAAVGLLLRPAPAPAQPLIAGCVALVWLSTMVLQVPLHRRLSRGRDENALRRLVGTNWLRTAAWSAKAALVAGTLA